MKKKYPIYFLFIFFLNFIDAQSITFISEHTHKPLSKVSVFRNDGTILAYSDIDGKIDKKELGSTKEKFRLVYNNYPLATLSHSDFDKNIIKLNDQIKEIETVVIKDNNTAKYIFIKGNFNSYHTENGKLECYVDGVITYIFDKETKKLKSTNIEQYRVYKTSSFINKMPIGSIVRIPNPKNIGTLQKYSTSQYNIRKFKNEQKDEIEIIETPLQGKEISVLGMLFFDSINTINISYVKDSPKTLKDLLEYNTMISLKSGFKNDPNYTQTITYQNFYPTEINFSNEKTLEKVEFDINNSKYKNKFWEDPFFPNMQIIFSSFFKDDLIEQLNKN